MTVDNTGFLVERLGEDCEPLQWVRELTQNSIEAILRLTDTESGEIVWDVDDHYQALMGVRKLCIIDNGVGMSAGDQLKYINRLSSSSSLQAVDRNFGIGAKIAGVTRNPEGLMYLSWQQGVGSHLVLWRDPVSLNYGARYLDTGPNGEAQYVIEVSDDVKPKIISQHGTKVTLLGSSSDSDTFLPPAGARYASKWLRRYLNTRYFAIPERVSVRVREGITADNPENWTLRRATGQKHFLDNNTESSGFVELDGAKAHWWILNSGDSLASNFGHYANSGHVAALYQNELYELAEGPSASAMLQRFGAVMGFDRVVIYVEPDPDKSKITANTARTLLLSNNERLPWTYWSRQFRDNLPSEIEDLMADISKDTEHKSHRDAIKERIKKYKEMFQFSRYKPTPNGEVPVTQQTAGGTIRDSGSDQGTGSSSSGGRGGNAGSIYAMFKADSPDRGDSIESIDVPTIMWISRFDQKRSRSEGQLEDRAAQYLKEQHMLLINADFRGYTDLVNLYAKMFESTPSARAVIEEVVREWFEQSLVESVLGLLALKDSPLWNPDQSESALSEEALTTAVMPRTFMNYFIRRSIGQKLGKIPEEN